MTLGPQPVNARPDTPPPDRACVDRSSPFFREDTARIGVVFKGVDRDNVHEYSVSEGWVRLIVRGPQGGMKVDRHGQPLKTGKLQGLVEPYWRS